VAINFTAKNPSRVKKLVLISSGGVRPRFTLKKIVFLIIAKIGKSIFSLPLLNRLFSKAQKLLYQAAREGDYYQASPLMKKTLQLITKEDQTKNLTKIKSPSLILWGGQDITTPLKDGKLMAKLLPRSFFKVFPNSTHALPFQKPSQVVKQILWFIS